MVSIQNYKGAGYCVSLSRNDGFKWQHQKGISLKGYFFYEAKLYDTVEEAAALLLTLSKNTEHTTTLSSLLGLFTLIISNANELHIYTDATRSFPIYYYEKSGYFFISDDFYQLVPANWQINEQQKEVFLHTGFTLGNGTLVTDVQVMEGGQYLSCFRGKLRLTTYFTYGSTHKWAKNDALLQKALHQNSDDWVDRLIKSVQGRTIVIPLSGGYDSRYVIAMLKHKGYEKVIAYTYGAPKSEEVAVSKQVAEALQYPWIFVDFTTLDESEYLLFNEKTDFYKYSHGGVASPHLQDLMAVKYMMEKQLIPKDSVVVPGICGDLFGGSQIRHLYKGWKLAYLNQMPQLILQHLFNIKVISSKSNLRQAIQQSIKHFPKTYEKDILLLQFDKYFLSQKVNKFVVNSCKVYEYFGLEWRLPLLDNEFAELWLSIAPDLKIDQNLYKNYLFKEVFAPYHIDFHKKKTAQQRYGWLLKHIPKRVFKVLRLFYKKKTDHNSIFQILRPFLNDLSPNEYEKRFINPNHIFSVWALKQLVHKWLPPPHSPHRTE